MEKLRELRERAFELLSDSSTAAAFVKAKIDETSLEIDGLEKKLTDLKGTVMAEHFRRSRPLDEVKEVIRDIGRWRSASADARTRVSDWIKRNVNELLVYSDGLEEQGSQKARQFSVLFSTGEFRTIQITGNDPTIATYSIHADDNRWILAENGKQSVHF